MARDKKEEQQKQHRATLAIADACRSVLFLNGFITDKENERVFDKIMKYKNKHRINISANQLQNVFITYKDTEGKE